MIVQKRIQLDLILINVCRHLCSGNIEIIGNQYLILVLWRFAHLLALFRTK